jgi:hypothetical protein
MQTLIVNSPKNHIVNLCLNAQSFYRNRRLVINAGDELISIVFYSKNTHDLKVRHEDENLLGQLGVFVPNWLQGAGCKV